MYGIITIKAAEKLGTSSGTNVVKAIEDGDDSDSDDTGVLDFFGYHNSIMLTRKRCTFSVLISTVILTRHTSHKM
jgi:hypothetical protein